MRQCGWEVVSVVLPFMGLFPLDLVTANPAGLPGTSTLGLPFSSSLLGLDAWLFLLRAAGQCLLLTSVCWAGLQTHPGGTSFPLHI